MMDSCYVSLFVPSGGYAVCKGSGFNPKSSSFTIESWLRLNGMGSGISVLRKEGVLDFGVDNGCLRLSTADGMTAVSDSGEVTVDTSTWHHLAVTYDLSFVRFFIDGIQAGSTAMSLTLNESKEEWRIGSDLDGHMRYLRIYNSALDASDIQSCMFNDVAAAEVIADVDFSCNPPVNHKSASSAVNLKGGAKMYKAWPALRLEGTAYALPANSIDLNPGGDQIDPYTIHARIYITGSRSYMAVMSNGDNNLDSGIALFLVYDKDKAGYVLKALRGSDSDDDNWLSSKGTVKSGQWVSVGCTYDGECLRLYIDGVRDSELETGPILMPREEGNVLIGGMLECGRPTGKNTFQGYMSRMEIWSVALDDEHMKALSNDVPEINSAGLTEAFDFTNVPARSETTNVAVALCDNARCDELLIALDASDSFCETVPDKICYEVDAEWIERMRRETDLDALDLQRRELFASGYNDSIDELEPVLGFKLTAEQREMLARRSADRLTNRNTLIGVTHHVLGSDYVLLAHYSGESEVIYRCHVSELDDCTLRIVELLFILIAGMVSALFGIKAKLSTRAITYINKEILGLAAVKVVMAAGDKLKAAQVYQIGKELSARGLLKGLLKMTVTLGFWALLRFLAKVALTFIGVGWADTIASLAATAITFGIAYVAYVKLCLPLPAVSLRELWFNHNVNRSDISALNIRVNHVTEVRRPEWLNGMSDPVAYCMSTVNTPVIKARFRIASLLPYTANVRAQAVAGNFLGDIPSTSVSFAFGSSGEVTLALVNQTIQTATIGVHQVSWNWQYYDSNTNRWILMGTTNHKVYLTGNLPGIPWTQAVNNDTQWPWTEVFDLSVQWMNGAAALAPATENITNGMYTCGMEYGLGFYLQRSNNIYTFNVTRFLNDVLNPATFSVECSECAVLIVLLANIWGNNLVPFSFMHNKNKVNTAYVKALGAASVWETHNFEYHVVAANGNNLLNTSLIYDGCVAVDASNNPWNAATPHVRLIPGTHNNAMSYGPPAPNVLNTPYVILNNYCDRFFENNPAGKTGLVITGILPIQVI